MTSNKWYQFRIVNTVMNYLLFWARDQNVTDNCQIYVMGRDGIYFESGPRDLYEGPYQYQSVVIPPGSRADIAVQCDCDSTLCNYNMYGQGGDTVDQDLDQFIPVPLKDTLLFRMEVENTGLPDDPFKAVTWTPQSYSTTNYLLDTTEMGSDEITAFCGQGGYLPSEMSQCNMVHGRKSYPAPNRVSMNQIAFDHTKSFAKICTGVTREWTVTTNWHPFHHHTWPFQLQTDVSEGWIGLKGDWRDTVGAPGSFRMRSNYFTEVNFTSGALIMHCHFVPHEDHGMMVWGDLQSASNSTCTNLQYIMPDASTSNITASEPPIGDLCRNKSAKTVIELLDVNAYINISLNLINSDERCDAEFEFAIKPRTVTVGNLWIGIGFEKLSPNSTFDPLFPNANPVEMKGHALIVSLLADDTNTPLATVTKMEVKLNRSQRTTTTIKDRNYFNCDKNISHINGTRKFTCHRPQCGNESEPFCNLNVDRNFIIAYGEGQFRPSVTYHSSRGGCAFAFEEDITCTISQREVNYPLPVAPQPSNENNNSDTPIIIGVSVGVACLCLCIIICLILRKKEISISVLFFNKGKEAEEVAVTTVEMNTQ